VQYVLVWQPEAGRLAQFPNLKAIISSAAGVDHILADPHLPDLPIVRMVTPETQQRMAEFTLMSSLMLLKDMPRIIAQQARANGRVRTRPHRPRNPRGRARPGGAGAGGGAHACHRLRDGRLGALAAQRKG
jgi:glyoxylate/hydroxypyruvate reductase A